MAEFLHQITKKREDDARINAMIQAQEAVTIPEWERLLTAAFLPPAGEEPF